MPHLVESRQRVQHDRVLLHAVQHLLVDDVPAPRARIVLHAVSEALALDARLVDDVARGGHLLQVVALLPIDAALGQVILDVVLQRNVQTVFSP